MKNVSIVCLAGAVALSLFGCASDKTSSNPDEQLPPVHLPEGDVENPIEKDKGYKVIEGTVYLDGEVLGTIEEDPNGKQIVVDTDGNTLAYIEQTGNGYRIIINHEGSGHYRDHYYIVQEDGKWTVDWTRSVVDHGWGNDSESGGKLDPAKVNEMKKQHLLNNIKAKKINR